MVIFISLFGRYTVQTNNNTKAASENEEYTDYLTAATHDAVKEMKNYSTGSLMADTETKRNNIINTFFNSLALNFGYDTDEDLEKLKTYVPAIAIIDNNGYYVVYNVSFIQNGKTEIKSETTKIGTWAEGTEHFMVRYYLGDNVDVLDKSDGRLYSGNYKDVCSQLKKIDATKENELEELWKKDGNDIFSYHKTNYIVSDLQNKIGYYINYQNRVATDLPVNYKFEMPSMTGDDWARTVKNPTVIAFMQGIRVSGGDHYLNIFSLGGGEVQKSSSVLYTNITSDGNTVQTAIKSKNTDNGGSDGYYANDKQAVLNGVTVDYTDENAQSLVQHSSHYAIKKTDGIHYVFRNRKTGEIKTSVGNKQAYDNETYEYLGVSKRGGCYTFPVYHKHTENCYKTTEHKHSASCGKTYILHSHTAMCYQDSFHVHNPEGTNDGAIYLLKKVTDENRTTEYTDGTNYYEKTDWSDALKLINGVWTFEDTTDRTRKAAILVCEKRGECFLNFAVGVNGTVIKKSGNALYELSCGRTAVGTRTDTVSDGRNGTIKGGHGTDVKSQAAEMTYDEIKEYIGYLAKRSGDYKKEGSIGKLAKDLQLVTLKKMYGTLKTEKELESLAETYIDAGAEEFEHGALEKRVRTCGKTASTPENNLGPDGQEMWSYTSNGAKAKYYYVPVGSDRGIDNGAYYEGTGTGRKIFTYNCGKKQGEKERVLKDPDHDSESNIEAYALSCGHEAGDVITKEEDDTLRSRR